MEDGEVVVRLDLDVVFKFLLIRKLVRSADELVIMDDLDLFLCPAELVGDVSLQAPNCG